MEIKKYLCALTWQALLTTVLSAIEFQYVPQNTAVLLGGDAILDCQASDPQSSMPLSYIWEFSGGPRQETTSVFFNHSLLVPDLRQSDLGEYRCNIRGDNSQQPVSRTATIIEAYTQDFFLHPTSKEALRGDTVTLSCVTGRTAPFSMAFWEKGGALFSDVGQNNATFGDVDPLGLGSQLSLTLNIKVNTSTAGSYRCVIVNSLSGEVKRSNPATISLIVPSTSPSVVKSPPAMVIASEDQPLSLDCVISGEPIPAIRWLWNGVTVINSERVNVEPNGTLYFNSVSQTDGGVYSCLGTNFRGSISTPQSLLQVAILGLQFIQQPSDVQAMAGLSAHLKCTPPDSTPPATVTWYKNTHIFQPRVGEFAAYIQKTDDGSRDLYFTKIQQSDAAEYLCVATNNYTLPTSRTSRVASLTVTGGVTFTEPPVDTDIIMGQLLSLRCKVTGNPQPLITWYKDGRIISISDRIIFRKDQQELYITEVTKGNEGTYTCNVTNAFNTVTVSAFVKVLVPPIIQSGVGHVTSTVRSDVVLSCDVVGDPQPSLIWTYNNVTIEESTRIVISNQELHIERVTLDDAGNYTCQAQNSAGTKSDTGYLTVIDPPEFVVPLVDQFVRLGQGVTFRCDVTGYPSPHIQWAFNGSNSLPTGYILSGDRSVLTLLMTTWDDSGIYTCSAENRGGQISKSAALSLTVSPEVVEITGLNILPEGHDLNLECHVTGIPTPSVNWFLDGHHVDTTVNGQITFPTSSSILVKFAAKNDSGTYKCKAENIGGNDESDRMVTIFGPPNPPEVLSVMPVSTSSVNITWSPTQQDPFTHVSYYVIRYKLRTALTYTLYRDDIPSTFTYYEVDGLRPAMDYLFVTSARNEAGVGRQGGPHAGTTFESAPSKPRNVKVIAIHSTDVELTWEVPAIPNGQIRQYRVQYRVKQDNAEFQWVLVNPPTLPLQQYTLQSLTPHTAYIMQVRAATDLENEVTAWGDFSDQLEITTLHAAPSGSPQNVTVHIVNSRMITVLWRPLLNNSENGQITHYVVTYNSSSPSTISQSENVDVSSNQVNISTDVLPWRWYDVAVYAVNEAGRGPESESVKIRTPPDVPSGSPQEVKVIPLTEDSILVTWEAVSKQLQNGPISGYIIEFGIMVEALRHKINVVGENRRSLTIRDLLPWTVYEVKVAALTSKVSPGQGLYSSGKEAQTLESVPGPVMNVRSTVSSHEITLQWLPPGVSTGYLLQYVIRIWPADDQIINPTELTVPGNVTTVLVMGLESDTLYQVNITAQTGAGEGEVISLSVKTSLPGETTAPGKVTTEPIDLLGSPQPRTENTNKHLPAIVAGCLTGGLALLFVIALLIYRCLKKRRKRKEERYRAYVSKGNEDVVSESGSDFQIRGASSSGVSDRPQTTTPSDSVPSYPRVPKVVIQGPADAKPGTSTTVKFHAVIDNNNSEPTMPGSAKEKRIKGIDNPAFLDVNIGSTDRNTRMTPEELYSQIDQSRKKQYRMRSESAAAIAVERNRGIQVLTGDKDSLIHNEAEIVYDERTAL